MAMLGGIITVIFGALVIAFPGVLRWTVGSYLILIGLLTVLNVL